MLKATTDRLRERPDLAHVWRNIDRPAEMKNAWESRIALIDDADTAGFVVQKVAPPGVPLSIRSMEDPLFGPVVSFGISGDTQRGWVGVLASVWDFVALALRPGGPRVRMYLISISPGTRGISR